MRLKSNLLPTVGYFRCMDHKNYLTFSLCMLQPPHLEELRHHHGKLHDHWQLQQLHNTRLDNEASSRWSLKNFPMNWPQRMEIFACFFHNWMFLKTNGKRQCWEPHQTSQMNGTNCSQASVKLYQRHWRRAFQKKTSRDQLRPWRIIGTSAYRAKVEGAAMFQKSWT